MPNDLLKGPKLKVDRAKRHISDLNIEMRRYLEREPYSLVIHKNGEWIHHLREPMPEQLPLILGDAVHNLRTALDVMACELVRLNGESDEKVYFPIAVKGPEDLDRAIEKRYIHRAAPDVVNRIKALEPYPGGKYSLCELHLLDIIDKHRIIVPIFFGSVIPNLNVPGLKIIDLRIGPVEDGKVDSFLYPPPDAENDTEVPATLEIAFDLGQPFANEPVLPTLAQLAQSIEGIVDTFIRFLRDKGH